MWELLFGFGFYLIGVLIANVFVRCAGFFEIGRFDYETDVTFWSFLWPVGIVFLFCAAIYMGITFISRAIVNKICPHRNNT